MPSRNTSVTAKCCVCADALPPGRPRRTCSDACRQAAWRRRHQPTPTPPALPTSRPRKPSTVYECPAPIRRGADGAGTAHFAAACTGCPLREQCTAGRSVSVGVHERQLVAARARQQDPDWIADYRATRPKVERKIGHLMRRHHGGRRARVRGKSKVNADFALLAAAINLARLAVLAVASTPRSGWVAAPGRARPELDPLSSSASSHHDALIAEPPTDHRATVSRVSTRPTTAPTAPRSPN